MSQDPRFKIVCTSYKAARWLPRCLESIAGQTYRDFDVAVADDASPGSAERQIIHEYCFRNGSWGGSDPRPRWTPILRNKNVDVLASQHECIEAICEDDDDIIVIVDGDDFLLHENVLQLLAEAYEPWVGVTYGSYKPFPDSATCPPAIPFPAEVVAQRSFREFVRNGGPVSFNHLRTYRYGVYRQIPVDPYFRRNGYWLRNGVDTAVMISAMEIVGDKHKVLDIPLLGYNSVNPLSYWRVKRRQLITDDQYILRLPPITDGTWDA